MKKYLVHVILAFFLLLTIISCGVKKNKEIQLTFDFSKNHVLDNNDNFSPDNQWLVYDTRTTDGGIAGGQSIEKVNVLTGEIVVLYKAKDADQYGPGVGAVSYSHAANKVVFIHGLQNFSVNRPYAQWRRTGVIIDEQQPGRPIHMDARDVTFPYTAGALRGGTHRHEWSGDGDWIGFTYNDAVMKALEDKTGESWNLRTIGVSTKLRPVRVDKDAEGENIDGEWFSALVVRVTPKPQPGSDDISHAAGDSWVGLRGYKKSDGSLQRARAFLGTVRSKNDKDVEEVYIVDIPDRIDIPGEYGPLQGTPTSFPMPPKGAVQRRLTHTAETAHPGCGGIVRSSPDGAKLAFLAKDEQGVQQVFLMSPTGGDMQQITTGKTPVQGGVRWSPDGRQLCFVWDNSIAVMDIPAPGVFSAPIRLTAKSKEAPKSPVWSHDGALIAFNRAVSSADGGSAEQVFIIRI